jgi:uncharacterized protein (TIGR02453 family)
MNKDLLKFLTQLKKNNNKEWFDKNRPAYEALRKQFTELVQQIINDITDFDDKVKGIEAKNTLFRINRDIRFSKDKTPYKKNFSAFISVKGRKSFGPGYYIHIQPGNESFVAGGVYMPEKGILDKIRQEIDYNGEQLLKILNKESFKRTFGVMEEDKLLRAPKGYEEDNPYIDLIKYKSFIVSKGITDKEIEEGKLKSLTKKYCKEMLPFIEFLYPAVLEE